MSNYYIDTIAAAHDRSTLNQMALLLCYLIIVLPPSDGQPIDFVLTPKGGNPLLAYRVAQQLGSVCLFRKQPNEASRSKADSEVAPSAGLVNIEGLHYLVAKARQGERRLYGVAIDCNCSGGSSIAEATAEFNDVVSVLSLNVRYIDRAYVLYRPDNDHDPRVAINRFFDLTEAVKKRLFDLKQGRELGPGSNAGSIPDKELGGIVESLRTQGLMICERGS